MKNAKQKTSHTLGRLKIDYKVKGDTMKFIQQGDVLIKAVAEFPEGKLVSPKERGFILAEGEATGHAHRIEDVDGVEMRKVDGGFYIRLKEPKTVTHEEHKPVTIPAGIWKVSGVKEYDHFAEEARRVQD